MSILGNRVIRREDPALLQGHGTFVDNSAPPDAAYVTYVRATAARGRVLGIACDDARGAPGVLAVVTADDVSLPDLFPFGASSHPMGRPLLARDEVRFVGEAVAAIVTETAAQGLDAAELVWVDLELEPAVVDPHEALRPDSPQVFADAESNIAAALEPRNLSASFDNCDVVIDQRVVNQRVAAGPLETRAATAAWNADDLLITISCQGAHPMRDEFCRLYGLDPDRVRVVCPDVGGSFGAKASAYPEQLLLPLLARKVDRPVRWTESRTENMLAMGHGRGQHQQVEIGGNRDGRIIAYRLKVLQEAGAYPMVGASLPWMTRMMLTGTYVIDEAEFSSVSVVTNTAPTAAYRGAGRPEATAAIERAIDMFANEISMDPAEVRRRNFIHADSFPYRTPTGTVYDIGDYERALDLALDAADYDALRTEQTARRARADRRQLGIGVSSYVEITAIGGGSEFGSVELQADGTVLARTGSTPYGQGHDTAWAMLISERLGIAMDSIQILHGDTAEIPTSAITGGSRSAQLAGAAMANASDHLVELARERAAEQLEASVADVTLDLSSGRFHVAGTPTIDLGWGDLASADSPLEGLSDHEASGPTFPFGAHVAVVDVDVETGQATLVRLVACDDAGTIINPLLVEGQVHGGLAQGAAQALLEEMVYDAEGNPTTANFADYALISATELPAFERVPMETPTPVNDLGAKGIGESGTVGSTPAVQNAVIDAVSHLGVRHIDMPCTPEKIWRSIQAAAKD
jgi:carbon-monoxide dehydrogenase large subunit